MGICSYCLLYQQNECFSWPEARGCGISGPDDPRRAERRTALDKSRANALRYEADELEKTTAIKVATLRAQAQKLMPLTIIGDDPS